jgi:DNA-binding response OmpR family regulator
VSASPALIIEDDPELAHIFSEALKLAGMETEMLRDGKMAQERLAEVKPSIVILDLHLPNVSGVDLLQYMRLQVHLRETPVIVVTADVRLAKTLEDQVDLVLLKPVSFAQLSQLARRIAAL